ncbi:MAG: excinuclease ABC subunit UvrC [Parachlamydiaceae bacterium]|nr:excinuclease ABC subunit UvrC [Parachlamydiaceae bacterium]
MPFDQKKLEAYPLLPGVYLMKNSTDHVIYVGKANSLRLRLKQYFSDGGDGRQMIPSLISKIEAIETIVVSSEKEALLLENTLIKRYKPKFNALLKDDKTYIALKLSYRDQWPMLQLVRYKVKPESNAYYFGPYTSAVSARATFDLLNHLFPLRQCSDKEFLRRTRPCILYDMKRCCAPCVGKCTKEEYNEYVQGTIRFLKGQDKEVLAEIKAELYKASEALEFERAGMLYKKIQQIENTLEKQRVDKPCGVDTDVLAIFRQADEVIICQLIFRQGTLTTSKIYNFSQIAQDDEELLESFLLQHYEIISALPDEILIPIELSDAKAISEIISSDRKSKVSFSVPLRGERKALLAMAYTNAEAAFRQHKDVESMLQRTLLEMQERLHLKNYPRRIECFDNSNLSGSEPVSSLVAYTEGRKDSNRYRVYKIKTAEGSDDYGAMREVLERRFKKGKEENDLPDLLIVDGGKGHLNCAIDILRVLDIVTIDLIGVAKEEGRHDKGATQEQIFLPNIKDPIILRSNSPILFLLQQIRDEAHRRAINFHRHRRSKKLIKSSLDDIKGIGPAKRKLLLNHFGSVKKLKEATLEELKSVKGLSQANINAIVAIHHPEWLA